MTRRKVVVKFSDDRTREIGPARIVRTVKAIIAAGLEEKFIEDATKAGARMTITKANLDFVKSYLADYANANLLEDDPHDLLPEVRSIARSRPRCD